MTDTTKSNSASTLLFFLPCTGGLFFVLLLFLLLYQRPYGLLWDGGSLRHISTGLYVLRDHILPTNNYLWAIDPGHPWQTHELMSEILFGAFYSIWQINGIALLASLAIATSLTWAFQLARARGLDFALAGAGLLAVIYTNSIHWSARPHVLTYLPFVMMYFLTFCWQGKHRYLAIFFTMLVWTNLHGSFYLGLIMLGTTLVCDLVSNSINMDEDACSGTLVRRVDTFKANATALGIAVFASCFNNRGPAFLTYVIEYMTSPVIMFNSDEWRSIDFSLGLPAWIFLVMTGLLMFIWTYAPKKPRLSEFAFIMLLLAFCLYGMRIISYFSLIVMIAAAPQWKSWSETIIESGKAGWLKSLLTIDQKLSAQEPNNFKIAAAWSFAAFATTGIWLATPAFKLPDFDPAKLPVTCSNYMKDHNITGLGFNWDNWGGYLFWKLGQKVFIDDYTDFYPRDFVDEYASIYFTRPGWEKALDKRHFQWVLIPRSIPLAFALKENPRWKLACEDEASVLLIPASDSSAK